MKMPIHRIVLALLLIAWMAVIVRYWIEDSRSANAVAAARVTESFYSGAPVEHAKRLMTTASGRSIVAPYLSHYFSLELEPEILQLLSSGKTEEKRRAVIGLISINAGDDPARTAVLALLRDPDIELRQLAAEYTARLGTSADLPILKTAQIAEQNMYTKSALEAAVSAINSRAYARSKLPSTLSDRWSALGNGATPSAKLALCQDILTHAPGTEDFAKAWSVFRDAADREPQFLYSGSTPAWHDCMRQRNALERLLLTAPCGSIEDSEELDSSRISAAPPIAKCFVPPIDAYFDPKRASYGHSMPNTGVFGNSVHVGDDCGWRRELSTVVSIGNGRVCRVSYIPSWGHILIIEHRLNDGDAICSLYAHTSPFLYVKLGESVVMGQKIATIGRSNSVENGGYGAHLHFGIYAGAYDGGIWISGYVDRAKFAGDQHGWQNPQEFLQSHR